MLKSDRIIGKDTRETPENTPGKKFANKSGGQDASSLISNSARKVLGILKQLTAHERTEWLLAQPNKEEIALAVILYGNFDVKTVIAAFDILKQSPHICHPALAQKIAGLVSSPHAQLKKAGMELLPLNTNAAEMVVSAEGYEPAVIHAACSAFLKKPHEPLPVFSADAILKMLSSDEPKSKALGLRALRTNLEAAERAVMEGAHDRKVLIAAFEAIWENSNLSFILHYAETSPHSDVRSALVEALRREAGSELLLLAVAEMSPYADTRLEAAKALYYFEREGSKYAARYLNSMKKQKGAPPEVAGYINSLARTKQIKRMLNGGDKQTRLKGFFEMSRNLNAAKNIVLDPGKLEKEALAAVKIISSRVSKLEKVIAKGRARLAEDEIGRAEYSLMLAKILLLQIVNESARSPVREAAQKALKSQTAAAATKEATTQENRQTSASGQPAFQQ